ncbi:putative transcription factor interactor and regulator CCHC(Zn) family [Helianthus annuus]|nr:putative transcription factor interactor and regulator CCHC(Zn) family [Helianthus annuus]KAJ0486682.1 putative transcription factor interactor and regulator CCHC(Zn) family [Helianthus annuus]KAJ0660814.1 putative transcription factor interactor and regulator CCHC(Zn) family [Helianthus annuus]
MLIKQWVIKMADGGKDDAVPRVTEQMREVIVEEVGKAIENSLSGFIDKIQNTVLSIVEERIKKLEDNTNLAKEKLGGRKPCSYKEFMACKPPIYNGEVDPIVCQRWLSDIKGVFERTHCDEDEREIELKKSIERGERRAQDVNPSPTKKARMNETAKKSDTKGSTPSCKICGKNHKGECRFKDKPYPICRKTGHMAISCPEKVTVCYNCYRTGHKRSECQELVGKKDGQDSKGEAPKAKARSFQLTAAEAKVEPDVVSGKESGSSSGQAGGDTRLKGAL